MFRDRRSEGPTSPTADNEAVAASAPFGRFGASPHAPAAHVGNGWNVIGNAATEEFFGEVDVTSFVPYDAERIMSGSIEADVAAVNDLRDREIGAAEDGDVDVLLSLRTEDFVAMPPNQDPVRGKESVSGFLSGMFRQLSIEQTVVSEEVVVSGDWAHDRGTFTGSARPRNGDEVIDLNGKYLWIARRDDDGSWKYAVQTWNDNS